MPTTRIATKNDLEPLLALMEKYYEYDRHDFDRKKARQAMRDLLSDRSLGLVLVTNDRNTMIGYLVLAFGYSPEYHGRDSFLDEFFINEDYRGKGTGKRCAYEQKMLPKS